MASELQKYCGNVDLAEWNVMVKACRESGMSVRDWCGQNGIPQSTYYTRQRKVFAAMKEETSQGGFYEDHSERTAGPAAVLHFGEVTVDVYSGAGEETVRSILRAIQSC
jgi:hypothetical protein